MSYHGTSRRESMTPQPVLQLASQGCRLFPVAPRAKTPLIADWPGQASASDEHIHFWEKRWPECNWAMATGNGSGIFVVDFDGDPGRAAFRHLVDRYGEEWTDTRSVRTHRGAHLWFQWPEGETHIRNSAGGVAPGIDVRGEGGYVLVPPSIHPSGDAYEWMKSESTPISPAPQWLLDLVIKASGEPKKKTAGNGKQTEGIPEGQRNAVLTSLAGSMRRRGMNQPAVGAALLAHNAEQCNPPLAEGEVDKIAASVCRYSPAEEIDIAVLGEHDLAVKFTERSPDLRYVFKWGRWMRYGPPWREDSVLEVFDRARGICTEIAAACNEKQGGTIKRLKAASTRAAVENMARSDKRHAATVEQWDADLMALGTPAHVCDLATGEVREQRPQDYLTRSTGASIADHANCPLWLGFLNTITAGDVELQKYWQRLCGYCLTGLTGEHAMFFLYGTGNNGKTVLCKTLMGILGNYAQVAALETFIETKNEQHPTNVAALRGARLVVSSEPKAGQSWDETKVKMLTGGDPIRARFIRCDEFEYLPQFKLLVHGNNKPSLRKVDEAIRRRLHLVPFVAKIPAKERVLDFDKRLRPEWPSILRWAVDGCREWQRQGLNPPAAVRTATADYLSAEDFIGSWIDERCFVSPQVGSTKAHTLYRDYAEHAEAAREFVLSQKRLSQELMDRGFQCRRSNGKVFDGIALKALKKKGVR